MIVDKIKNTRIPANIKKYSQKAVKPVFDMKDTYQTEKSNGRGRAVLKIIKENGACTTTFAALGLLIGTFVIPLPGTGILAGLLGFVTGKGLDLVVNTVLTAHKKLFNPKDKKLDIEG